MANHLPLTPRSSSPLPCPPDAEKSINNILDYVGGEGKGFGVEPDLAKLERFYEATKRSLEEARNEVRPPPPYLSPLHVCALLTDIPARPANSA